MTFTLPGHSAPAVGFEVPLEMLAVDAEFNRIGLAMRTRPYGSALPHRRVRLHESRLEADEPMSPRRPFPIRPTMRSSRNPIHTKEYELVRLIRNMSVAAATAAVLVASSVGPALAQAIDHSHDAAALHKLTLNQGKKWGTDEPLRGGMGRIRGLIEPHLGAAHKGKLTPAQYSELATQIETEVGGIVAKCKLEPKADAMLHLLIADLGDGTRTMTGNNPKQRPALGLVKVAKTLDQYGKHFEHPGFMPVGIGH